MKIAILGAAGRMGKSLLRCAERIHGCQIVAAIEHPAHPLVGESVASALGIRHTALAPDLHLTSAWSVEAQVSIDFTLQDSVEDNLRQAVANGQAYVLGTTGLMEAGEKAVRQAAATIPIVWAPNMSMGVNLLFELVRRAAAALGPEYDAEIVELHHRHKKDAPSGTALGLAQALATGRGVELGKVANYGREGLTGERPSGEIGIHALRGGAVVGDHTVMFMADEERIELTHKAVSRDAFSTGALRAALWLESRVPGLYNMRHVLGFEPTAG